jgi:hypothetical protein
MATVIGPQRAGTAAAVIARDKAAAEAITTEARMQSDSGVTLIAEGGGACNKEMACIVREHKSPSQSHHAYQWNIECMELGIYLQSLIQDWWSVLLPSTRC